MASQSRKDQRVLLLVVIQFVVWGSSQQGFRHVKNAWKIERTSFVKRRNHLTSLLKLSPKHFDHRLDSSDDVTWMWKRRPSGEEAAPCAGDSRNVGALVAASSKKVAVARAVAIVVNWLS
ncbi:hypothetical protein NL676_018172 [Syzygium grande]|nr:hypothetical protein NL676_018172 [Syzygium grande]